MSMSKKDLIMAQKAVAARQVKNQQQLIKGYIESTKGHSKNGKSAPISQNDYNLSASLNSLELGESRQFKSGYLPEISSPSTFGKETAVPQKQQAKLTNHNQDLVHELAKRATTAKTGLRKMNSEVNRTLQQAVDTNTMNHSPSFNDPVPVHSPRKEGDDNFFMPKVSIPRPDGATLSDIYKSKKEDTWSKILKAQLKEEEEQKVIKKKQKALADEAFGNLLKKQIADNRAVIVGDNKQNNIFAALEDATAKRMEDLQKKRTEDAINRHKQFINNALEDIHTKKVAREKALLEDITANNVMINKAKQLIADDERKKAEEKEYFRRYQEALFQENLANVEKKANQRLVQFSEDKRIIAENDRQFMKEQKRREEALKTKMVRSSEGPAHHIVAHLVEAKKTQEAQFYHQLFNADNSLNKQLKTSEDAANARSKSNGDELTAEWVKNAAIKAAKKKADEDRNNKILETMAQMLARQEREDIAKREKQRQDALKYQRELDQQLNTLRQRSQDQLTKTMSEAEIKYNAGLIRKTNVVL